METGSAFSGHLFAQGTHKSWRIKVERWFVNSSIEIVTQWHTGINEKNDNDSRKSISSHVGVGTVIGMLIRKWTRSCTFFLIVKINYSFLFLMSIACFYSHEYLNSKSIRESRSRFLVKIESKWVGNLPVSAKWL